MNEPLELALANLLRTRGWQCQPPPARPVIVRSAGMYRYDADARGRRTVVGSHGYDYSRAAYADPYETWMADWDNLHLPTEIRNAVIRHGFTIADVRNTPVADLSRIRDLGRVRLSALLAAVDYHAAATVVPQR